MEPDATADQDDVREEEREKDGQQDPDRLLDAAQVEDGQHRDRGQLDRQLPYVPLVREVAEDRLAARRDRGGASENVIDAAGRAAHHAGPGPDQAGSDDVAAAAERETPDDLRVGGGAAQACERSGRAWERRPKT